MTAEQMDLKPPAQRPRALCRQIPACKNIPFPAWLTIFVPKPAFQDDDVMSFPDGSSTDGCIPFLST